MQLMHTQAVEVIEHGIRVNAIGVGDVVTHLFNHFMDDGPGFLAEMGKPRQSARRLNRTR